MTNDGRQLALSEQQTDEELLEDLRAGNSDAFGPLVRRYERELYGYLRRYLGDAELAQDVFQNTFLQVYQKIDQYQPGRPVRPWLYTIATHQAIDAMRRAGRRPTVSLDQYRENDGEIQTLLDMMESRQSDPFEQIEGRERQERVREGVDGLPDHLRETVILAYYQGLKYREIADILNIPVGTVKSRLHMALRRLHEAWQASGAVQEEV